MSQTGPCYIIISSEFRRLIWWPYDADIHIAPNLTQDELDLISEALIANPYYSSIINDALAGYFNNRGL